MNSVFNDIGASDIEMVVPYKIVVDIGDYIEPFVRQVTEKGV